MTSVPFSASAHKDILSDYTIYQVNSTNSPSYNLQTPASPTYILMQSTCRHGDFNQIFEFPKEVYSNVTWNILPIKTKVVGLDFKPLVQKLECYCYLYTHLLSMLSRMSPSRYCFPFLPVKLVPMSSSSL